MRCRALFGPLRDLRQLQKRWRKAKVGCEVVCYNIAGGRGLGEGATTHFHLDADRDFHAGARTSEKHGRRESGIHEPDHQPAQSAAVPTERRRGASFRPTARVRASDDHRQMREIDHEQERNPLA
jgi:hypothetical protein